MAASYDKGDGAMTTQQDMAAKYPDLFMGTTLLTSRLSQQGRTRYDSALWYVWGRQDAGDVRTRGTRSGHYLGDDFAFAQHAALEAEAFYREHATMLSSIGAQYDRFVEGLPS